MIESLQFVQMYKKCWKSCKLQQYILLALAQEREGSAFFFQMNTIILILLNCPKSFLSSLDDYLWETILCIKKTLHILISFLMWKPADQKHQQQFCKSYSYFKILLFVFKTFNLQFCFLFCFVCSGNLIIMHCNGK